MRDKLIIVFKRLIRPGKFAVTGAISAAVSLCSLIVFTEWFGMWYLAASVLAYVVTFVVNFSFQKLWTFRNLNVSQTPSQMARFFAVSLLNLVLNTAFMYGLVDLFALHHVIAQVLVIGVLAVMNYTLYRLYIFRVTPTSERLS